MTAPVWTILIPTLGRRGEPFGALLASLLPQTEPYGGQVTVLGLWNNGERPLAVLRDELMEGATAEFTCFVDDDDELPGDYVAQVYPRLHWGKPDYIGWRMQMVDSGVHARPTFHSLAYGGWWEDQHGHYRDISHLNPVRREVALAHARFADPSLRDGLPEDTNWADQMRGHLSREHVIGAEHCMYLYRRDPAQSTWQGIPPVPPGTYTRPEPGHPHFSWHPASST